MAFQQINGANIYYQIYGDDHPGRFPVLLIHGSTITGEIDWSDIVHRLAADFRVYVPDCRGHGKSNNLAGGYSFRQMSDDMAVFIKAMGYERMHIIGHSNGGNVALVTVMEHPDVTQSAVLQAANAYVTDYLREREPIVLDPDYFAAHHPADVAQMILTHSDLFGELYWRDLLKMTMQEIISEPNYTVEELSRVELPVLVIMGSDDGVNAPDKHAQFIAENIPQSELWIPEGIGHNVHHEIPDEWCARVLNFIKSHDN